MKKKRIGKMLGVLLAAAMTVSMAGCGNTQEGENLSSTASKQESQTVSTESQTKEETQSGTEFSIGDGTDKSANKVKVTMYPADANISSGVITGYKADIFAKHGIELEVWAFSDEKTNAILVSGDLPDIMYVSKDNLDTMIEEGMLLCLDDYLDQMPHVQSYTDMAAALNNMREYRSAGTGKIYGLPLSVGDNQTKQSLADSTERSAVKLRWDIYEEIGAPKINNFEDLIDVMEQMLKAHPTDEDGNPFYGTVLNNGSDSSYWACMNQWYAWQGYSEKQLPYLLETNMVSGENTSILTKDSLYYKGLKWYNEVYRRGLMDPDSINNDRATQKVKVDAGYAMVPSGYLPGWATKYYQYYIPGTNIYYSYKSTYGDANKVIAINAKTENLEACLELLDMWCDPDTYLELINGPEGEFWYADGENAYPTEDSLEYMLENGGKGRDTYSTGEEAKLWNISFCINTGAFTSYKDGKGNNRLVRVDQWSEVQEIKTSNETFEKWKATTGYDSWNDWLAAEGAYYHESSMDNVNTFCSAPSDSMQLIVDAIKDKVVNASWKMVYAETDAEFDQIWDEMVKDCEGLGAQEIIDWRLEDIANAQAIVKSLAE